MFFLQRDVTTEGSSVFTDVGSAVSIRNREGRLKLVIGTGSLFLDRIPPVPVTAKKIAK